MIENVRRLLGILDYLPGVALARGLIGTVEREILHALKDRLDELDAGNGAAHRPSPRPAEPPAAARTPAALLTELLSRSMDQTFEESQRSYFLRILHEIVPDEARILAALADGSRYPLLDVGHGTRSPSAPRSGSGGRAAGVPDAAPLR